MAAQQRRRSRWPAYAVTGIAVWAALVPGPGHAVGTGAEEAARRPVPTATAHGASLTPLVPPVLSAEPAPLPAIGAYLDYGPRGVARMARLSRWLGGADLRVGHTYLPGDLWTNIEGAPRFLDAWAAWRRSPGDAGARPRR
ncbi:hypothetical protein [Streptomyces afghaniensis]|uniref:hypothetical protein n=1 Tax=Streptomyces afghaniensis TaxID=66865 RepID=UPI002785E330|nr:hypothetical protein [Streptomyces afghaniensis]